MVSARICELINSLTRYKTKNDVDFLPALDTVWLETNAEDWCADDARVLSQAIHRLLHDRPGLRIEFYVTSNRRIWFDMENLCQDLAPRFMVTYSKTMVPSWPQAWDPLVSDLCV